MALNDGIVRFMLYAFCRQLKINDRKYADVNTIYEARSERHRHQYSGSDEMK